MSGRQLILVTISLSAEIKGEDFENFMEQNVFPTIRMRPTRVGQIGEGDLLKKFGSEGDYIWAIW
jgi:hypothetical protein